MAQKKKYFLKWIKKIILWTSMIVAACFVCLVLFIDFFDWNSIQPKINIWASRALGRQVTIDGPIQVSILSSKPHITLEHLKIANPDWAKEEKMLDVGRITLQLKALPLLRGALIFQFVEIDKAFISLYRQASGEKNWDFGTSDKKDEAFHLPVIQRLEINQSQLIFIDEKLKLHFKGTVEAVENANQPIKQPFHLQGDGRLNEHDFNLEIRGASLFHAEPGKPYPFDLQVAMGKTTAILKGVIPEPFNLGRFDATLSLAGEDLADLYYLTTITFPNTPPYKLTGTLNRHEGNYRFQNFSGTVGNSDLQGNLSVNTADERPKLTADLSSKLLDLKDLGSLFGARTSGGAPSETVRLLPDAPLQLERVRSMDAMVHYRAEKLKAWDLPMREVALDLALEKSVLNITSFAFDFPRGRLSGSAVIDARQDIPDVDMDVRLSNAHLEDFFQRKQETPPLEGLFLGRAKLHGKGNSVHRAVANANGDVTFVVPKGAVRQAFAELISANIVMGLGLLLSQDQQQVGLRCGVANFKATNGILQAQSVVLDTDTALITGKGDVNLDSETLNLEIQGQPKELSLLHVLMPVTLTGTLRHPKIGVAPEKTAAQVGLAAVLGALLTPLAALLPFVDPGLAEDADCASLISEAHEKGAPINPQIMSPSKTPNP